MKNDGSQSRWRRTTKFIYNRDKGTFIGRTCKSWAQIFVFYVCAYTFLGAFFYGMLSIFLNFYVDPNVPNLTGLQSVLKLKPGVGVHPRIKKAETFIHLTNYESTMNGEYLKKAREFLNSYNATDQNADCSGGNVPAEFPRTPCRFPISELGVCQNPDTAISNGGPCVYIRLNKVYGWLPDIDNSTGFNNAAIRCTGQNDVDTKLLGKPKYYPSIKTPEGEDYGTISSLYFPFLNQPGYHTPVVAVQFPEITLSTLVLVECQVFGLETDHSTINFEITVDGRRPAAP